MPLTFVTGNDEKWQSATTLLAPFGVVLVQARFELPEIQSMQVEEVAAAAAELACAKVGGPVIVTDAGYYFEALNGFPGPFIKYVNQTLTGEDFIRLMEGKDDRRVVIRECLAYCAPGMVPVTFSSEQQAKLALKVEGGGTAINQVLVLDGFDKVVGLCEASELRTHWHDKLGHYGALGEWLVAQGLADR